MLVKKTNSTFSVACKRLPKGYSKSWNITSCWSTKRREMLSNIMPDCSSSFGWSLLNRNVAMWSSISSKLAMIFVCSFIFSIEIAKSTSTQISTSGFSCISERELSWIWKNYISWSFEGCWTCSSNSRQKTCCTFFFTSTNKSWLTRFSIQAKSKFWSEHISYWIKNLDEETWIKGRWKERLHIYFDHLKIGKTAANYHKLQNMEDQCHLLKNFPQVRCHPG